MDSLSHRGPRRGGRAWVPHARPHPAEGRGPPGACCLSLYPSDLLSRPAPARPVSAARSRRDRVPPSSPLVPAADVRTGCPVPSPARPRVSNPLTLPGVAFGAAVGGVRALSGAGTGGLDPT